jgi:hypothetical protein
MQRALARSAHPAYIGHDRHVPLARFPDPAERRRVATRLQECISQFNTIFPSVTLYPDEMQDRGHIVAFCDVMATTAAVAEPFLPEKPSPPTQLHAT